MQKSLAHNFTLQTLIKREVRAVWREVLGDPDRGLELRAGAVRRLKRSLDSKRRGLYNNLDTVIRKQRI